jgi:predicted enzyme related to lactoylglutathione lyase
MAARKSKKTRKIPAPVVHFEIQGKNAKKSVAFYASLFNWKIQYLPEMSYGMVDAGGPLKGKINGGIASAKKPFATFYAAVPDINATLAQVKKMGGKVTLPRTEIPGVTMAMFKDPDGISIGLVEG